MTDREAIDYLHNEVVGLSGIDISREEIRQSLKIYQVVQGVRRTIELTRKREGGAAALLGIDGNSETVS